ncbi:MAG: M81 family metallopeptidase [Anaerolineaceae bacterium]|nr:M81 family metallopeptidase [Anaerolineaceae bacterium]
MASIGIAGFLHETNTFSPIETTFESFDRRHIPLTGVLSGEEILVFRGTRLNSALAGCINTLDELGDKVVPIVAATEAEPSAPMPETVFEQILCMMLQSLQNAPALDGLFIDLHGAMVFGDFKNGEDEILKRVRQVVGNIPIVSSLDTHGNISPTTFDLASALVGYRTYPHIDIYETGVRCAHLLHHMVNGNPVYKSFRQIPFMMPGDTMATNHPPSSEIYQKIFDLEKQDKSILCGSIMQGFFSADMPYTGSSVFTYGTSQEKANLAADSLYDAIMLRESEFISALVEPDKAVSQAIQLSKTQKKPIILADMQDNAGGGSSSDTVGILKELLKQNAPETALGLLFDPQAAELAHQAGEGAEINLELGGKLLAGHQPLQGTFLVEKISDGKMIGRGDMWKDFHFDLGRMAQLKIGNMRIAVASVRIQMYERVFFEQVGIDAAQMQILVLKSSNHYRAEFEPLASEVINVCAPGGLVVDPSKAVYRNLRDGVRLGGHGPVYQRQ